MKKILNWVIGLYNDEKGSPSSKRFIGILCGITLCITLFINSYSHGDIKPSESLVNAVAMLAFGCLGLSSIDKIWGKRNLNNTDNIDNKEN